MPKKGDYKSGYASMKELAAEEANIEKSRERNSSGKNNRATWNIRRKRKIYAKVGGERWTR